MNKRYITKLRAVSISCGRPRGAEPAIKYLKHYKRYIRQMCGLAKATVIMQVKPIQLKPDNFLIEMQPAGKEES